MCYLSSLIFHLPRGAPYFGPQKRLTPVFPHGQWPCSQFPTPAEAWNSLGSASAVPPLRALELRVIYALVADTPTPCTNNTFLVSEICTFLITVSPTEAQHSCSLKNQKTGQPVPWRELAGAGCQGSLRRALALLAAVLGAASPTLGTDRSRLSSTA